MAASCVEELRRTSRQQVQNASYVGYFFFEYGKQGSSSHSDALRALLAQILQQSIDNNAVLDCFAFVMSSKHREGQNVSTRQELSELLSMLIEHLKIVYQGTVYLVLDGIDECDEPDDLLLQLWKMRLHSNLRVIFFSRPNVGFLRRFLVYDQTITVGPLSTRADLHTYFQSSLQYLLQLRLLPSTINMQELITNLQTGADGMFLWARLMMSYLRSPAFSPARRIAVILALQTPERLDEIYDRILCQLSKSLRHEQYFARSLFMWLIFGQAPLSDRQLHDISHGEGHNATLTSTAQILDELNEFRNAVIITCGGIVEFRANKCHFVHHSALEYFQMHCSMSKAYVSAASASTAYYFPASVDAHVELAIYCLSYMLSRVPAQPLSGAMTQTATHEQLDSVLPFLRYAALSWAEHLFKTCAELPVSGLLSPDRDFRQLEALLGLVSRFLRASTKLMSWIEAIYTFAGRNQPAIEKMMADMTAWSDMAPATLSLLHLQDSDQLPATMAALSQDLRRLYKHWGDTLTRLPN